LFAAPLSWIARPRSASPGDVDRQLFTLVVPFDVQSPDSALALGRRAGARRVILGQIRRDMDSLTVIASVYEVASGQPVGQRQRTAPAGADPRPLLDTLSRELLGATGRPPSENHP
jgi:hypothetical protein